MTALSRTPSIRVFALTAILLSTAGISRAGQVRISPGPLAKAHAALEGVTSCLKCHDATGRSPSAEKCLGCHKPIAERIARKTGVHRAVGNNCMKCHAEHRGVDGNLRPLNTETFNHAGETGFVIENRHAKLAATCSACHKSRTFLDVKPECSCCHKDVHKGSLGTDCTKCHSTEVVFKETRKTFDHTRAQFHLIGAHREVACEKCHVGGVFRGLRFDACSSCHKAPHRNVLAPLCTSCHTPESWKTRTIEHARTGFVLVGLHAQVACAKCHTAGVRTPLHSDKCSACHVNVHRDSVKDDCRKCHNETGFKPAKFDHGVSTGFALTGKHEPLACRKCHTKIAADDVPLVRKVIDFSGLSPACVGCHQDQHKTEYGRVCESCHRPDTFKAAGFVHPRSPEFFGGRHQGVACVKCHVRPADGNAPRTGLPASATRARTPVMTCATCHADPHLGQVGTSCDRCHAIEAAKFAPVRFNHDSGKFPLTGKHRAIECVKCHPSETRAYPAGSGTAKRFTSMATECRNCHKDPHLGQVEPTCTTCHSTGSFKLLTYAHKGMDDFFAGFHGRLPCKSCHKTETGQFPAGPGTAMRLKVGRTCASCHPYF